eukprot:3858693-Amphidinium_carterae.2
MAARFFSNHSQYALGGFFKPSSAGAASSSSGFFLFGAIPSITGMDESVPSYLRGVLQGSSA